MSAKPIRAGSVPYLRVNGAWPKPLPPLTPAEISTAAKRLWLKFYGYPLKWPIRLTSGRRYSCLRRGTFVLNPTRGWSHLVHDLSHVIFYRKHPDLSPHDYRHAVLEGAMVDYVVTHGWLDGKLRREPKPKKVRPKPTPYERCLARLAVWETKRRRAETAIKKLKRSKAAFERAAVRKTHHAAA